MKKVAALLALALASFALVACGSSDDSDTTTTTTSNGGGETSGAAAGGGKEEGGGGSSTVEFEADPEGQLAYTITNATTEAGQVTIDFKNPQALTHDVQIEDSKGNDVGGTELIADGTDSATLDLKPGTYTFYCSVPGHREGGMEGTLSVK